MLKETSPQLFKIWPSINSQRRFTTACQSSSPVKWDRGLHPWTVRPKRAMKSQRNISQSISDFEKRKSPMSLPFLVRVPSLRRRRTRRGTGIFVEISRTQKDGPRAFYSFQLSTWDGFLVVILEDPAAMFAFLSILKFTFRFQRLGVEVMKK